jgi:hypothetical protein
MKQGNASSENAMQFEMIVKSLSKIGHDLISAKNTPTSSENKKINKEVVYDLISAKEKYNNVPKINK